MSTYSVFEWTIENFSCWNYEIHGNMIPFPRTEIFGQLDEIILLRFYPKGLRGDKEHLFVRIWNPFLKGDCELSFIGSDGSIIWKESRKINEYTFGDYTGPKFENVITEIRKREAVYTDTLTLRCRIRICFYIFQKLHTAIDIFSTSLKINCEFCNDDNSSLDRFSQIQYPIDDGKSENLDFFIVKTSPIQGEVNLNFELKSHGKNTKKTLAQICISHQQSDEAVLKHEEAEHILREKDKWISKKALPIKKIDISEKACYVILDLKIITGNKHKTYSHWSLHPDKTEITLEDTTKIRASFSNPLETTMSVFTKEMMSLYQNKTFTDFQLHCGQETIAVHKAILSARSPVLKTLLATDMREASSGIMDIEDLDIPTLARFIRFLYTGFVEADLPFDSALKLYYAADKYQVSTLKKKCVSVLSANVATSNVREILTLAHRHQDEELTWMVRDFILTNYEEVLESKAWMDFIGADPILVLKTLALLVNCS